MAEVITCAQCQKETERPRHFRQKDYCSVDCINKVIDQRNAKVVEAAVKKLEQPTEEQQ